MPGHRVPVVLLAVLCLIVLTAVPSSAAVVPTTTAWRDDFTALNRQTWNVVDWGCFDARNVTVANGLLRLRTVATSSPTCPLVGGRIDTYKGRTFAPGTYAARIKFAPRLGSGESFWMTGASGRPFPSNGEIDIAETLGRTPTVHHLRLHSAYSSGKEGRCTQKVDLAVPAGFLSQWHTYSATTSATRGVFRIDGRVVASFQPNGKCTWPFGEHMRAILQANGGAWQGPPDKSLFPMTTYVDWFSYRPN
jgi:beta-glucanase (GH16 family)